MTKTFPTPPTNPSDLMDLLVCHTKTITKVRAIRGSCDTPTGRAAHFDAAGMETQAVAALTTLLFALHPSKEVLRRVIVSESPEALQALFAVHGSGDYRDIMKPDNPERISLSTPVTQGQIQMFRVLKAHGIDLSLYLEKMIQQACRHRRSDYLSFVRDELVSDLRLLDCANPGALLDDPWPEQLPRIASELREIAADAGHITIRSMVQGFDVRHINGRSLRSLAICIHLLPDLPDRLDTQEIMLPHRALLDLVEKLRSNHGRLQLLQMEPSLEGLLSRPREASFYGLTEADVIATT